MVGRLRRITVYETPSRFYLVGCDTSGTRFNVLKIDRVDCKALVVGEPESIYSRDEILELLATISEGNSVVYRSQPNKKSSSRGGLIERVSNAFGILGVVRFLEGYYIIVVTKANVAATFGYHTIYKIAEVAMISIAMDGISTSNEEQRYVRLFQSVDLSTDFYFSYTYDLSRSLQENALSSNWGMNGSRKLNSDTKFIWNSYLLHPLRQNLVSERWFIEVVHGYVGQQLFDLPSCKLSLTLIGRRSAEYAGTRFLKRGANLHGSVANDVETEQIVWDMGSSPNLSKGRFSAFSQRRGSVPLRWSQDPATRGVVGKPLILIDVHEPHAQTAGAHFRELRKKYGSPIIVMNLVKRREKRRHEVLLHEQFLKAVTYLNQFVPQREQICYLSFDVARCNKQSTPANNVLTKLDEIAMKAVQKHGWFQSFPLPYSRVAWLRPSLPDYEPETSPDGRFLIQQGISRTNCVDCLDRTNVAQFGIGKAALACQLYTMGVLDTPSLSLQSEVCRVYEDLMDRHGDTMAWQYAGSQLVHSIKTYKKTAAFQERSRDVIQTLSRYYSNTFADYDKQAAINLFLGKYRPQISSSLSLWDLTSDYYLHFPTNLQITTDYCAWIYDDDELDDYVLIELGQVKEPEPSKSDKGQKTMRSASREIYGGLHLTTDDDFRDHYRTFEMTTLENRIKIQQSFDQRALAVSGINHETPTSQFALWKSDGKYQTSKNSKKEKVESDDDDDEDGETPNKEDVVEYEDSWNRLISRRSPEKQNSMESYRESGDSHEQKGRHVLATGLQLARDIYGLSRFGPPAHDRRRYEKYADRAEFRINTEDWNRYKPTLLTEMNSLNRRRDHPDKWRASFFTTDDAFQCGMPEVARAALQIYEKSCDVEHFTASKRDAVTFATYPSSVF